MTFRGAVAGDQHAEGIASALINFNIATPFTVDIVTIPAGAAVKRAWAEILTAFNAATTNVVFCGHAADDDAYLTTADVVEGTPGVSPAGGKGPFAAETAERIIQAKYTQTGTAATAGQARVYVEWITPAA